MIVQLGVGGRLYSRYYLFMLFFMLKLTAYYSFQIASYSHTIPLKHNIDAISSHTEYNHQTINNGHMTLSINECQGEN